MEEGKFTIVDADGNEIECDILFTFESNETHKNYIVYTDNTQDKQGNIKVYASIYDPQNLGASLAPIESEAEWKVIEDILEKVQKEVCEDDDMDHDSNSNADNGIELEMKEDAEQPLDESSFARYISEKKDGIKEKEGKAGQLGELLDGVSSRLVGERELSRVDVLFDLLDGVDGIPAGFYSNMAMAAYEKQNFAVAETAYRKAVDLCSDSETCVEYKNNLAYLIRRGEIRRPEERSAKEAALLLRDGTEKKDTFSLINMALLWALGVGKDSDWDMADNLASFVDENNVMDAFLWWRDVADAGEAEGYLVHLLLLRHGKVGSSPLGSIEKLFARVKEKYPGIPEKMNSIVTPFAGDMRSF